jgi:hypothetical protein
MASQGAGELEWVVEGIAGFLQSPLWTTPIHNFIDENCIYFSDAGGEQSFEHTKIHKQFQVLVDRLLTDYIEELGVPLEDVLKACETTNNPHGAKLIEYIFALDKYETFVLLMARRNAELEKEALQQLNRLRSASNSATNAAGGETDVEPVPPHFQSAETSPSKATEQPPPQRSVDEDELKAAIAASLVDVDERRRREMELEEEELQRALQLSLALEQQRVERELERCREEVELRRAREDAEERARVHAQLANEEASAKSKAERDATVAMAAEQQAGMADAAAAMRAREQVDAEQRRMEEHRRQQQATAAAQQRRLAEEQEVERIKTESAARQAEIHAAVQQAREDNVTRAAAPATPPPQQQQQQPQQKPQPTPVAAPAQPAAPTPSQTQQTAPPQQQQQHQPGELEASPSANQQKMLPGLSNVRGGKSGAVFGSFAKLPSIHGPSGPAQPAPQPTFEELKAKAGVRSCRRPRKRRQILSSSARSTCASSARSCSRPRSRSATRS